MARPTRPTQTTPRRRKERKPFIPEGTITHPTDHPVEHHIQRPTDDRISATAAQKRAGTRTVGVPITDNYKYVKKELVRTTVISAFLIFGMVGLWFVIR